MLTPGTRDEAAALRAAFERGGLTTAGLAAAFGLDDGDRAVMLGARASVQATSASALVRLWFAGEEAEAGEVAALVAPLTLGRLEELGLVRVDADAVVSDFRITPLDGAWFAGDRPTDHLVDLPDDYVLGPTASAMTTLHLTVRRPGRLAVDIGTGCGLHAVLAARHHEHVIGTDISERALALGRWAAWVNGVANVEWRAGDLFEPVAGERFDLVVSCPPYVITPDVTSTFRDSALEGDGLSRAVVTGAADHLAPGGVCTVLANWGCSGHDDDDASPPLAWLAGRGVDSLALVHRVDPLVAYASRWAEPVARTAGEQRSLTLRWAADYEAAGWDRIASGAVVARRPRDGAARWSLGLATPSSGLGQAGAEVAGIVERCDLLAGGVRDDLVLDTAPFVVEQTLGPLAGGGLRPIAASIRLGGGLPFSRDLDRVGLALLERVDGVRPLGSLTASVADALGVGADQVASRVREVVTELATLGFLVPVPAAQ